MRFAFPLQTRLGTDRGPLVSRIQTACCLFSRVADAMHATLN